MASKIIEKAKDALGGSKGDVKVAGTKVHSTGYGLMGLTWRPKPQPAEDSFAAMSEWTVDYPTYRY